MSEGPGGIGSATGDLEATMTEQVYSLAAMYRLSDAAIKIDAIGAALHPARHRSQSGDYYRPVATRRHAQSQRQRELVGPGRLVWDMASHGAYLGLGIGF